MQNFEIHSHGFPRRADVRAQRIGDPFTEVLLPFRHLQDDLVPVARLFQWQAHVAPARAEVAKEFHGGFLTANYREFTRIHAKTQGDSRPFA